MESDYLMIHALEPVRYASAGRVETMKPFCHPTRTLDSYVLLIGIRGSLFIEQEGQLYEVGPGHTLLLKKGIKHRGIKPSKPGLSYYWFHFNLDNHRATYLDKKQMDEQIMRFRQEPYSHILASFIFIPTFFKPPAIERLNILFNQLTDLAQGGCRTHLGASYIMTSLLIELSEQLIASYASPLTKTSLQRDLSHIMEWIRVYANQPLTVKRVSDQFNYNPDYLTRQFKQHIGMSLQKYITLVKMTKAKDILSRTRRTIKEVAADVGIQDEKYFMRLFKKTEGMTPTAFRKAFYRIHLTNLKE
ncbi:AraC family transcriptional regulator [Shouchella clausii]|nr:AraC family transcriptional regulator [Shouchella clausii]MEB5480596.1 AraC family transcriptional regulator [Shouchella clausii]PAE98219.1 hypothetical protein CHH71_05445 [Shouchella clausii]